MLRRALVSIVGLRRLLSTGCLPKEVHYFNDDTVVHDPLQLVHIFRIGEIKGFTACLKVQSAIAESARTLPAPQLRTMAFFMAQAKCEAPTIPTWLA